MKKYLIYAAIGIAVLIMIRLILSSIQKSKNMEKDNKSGGDGGNVDSSKNFTESDFQNDIQRIKNEFGEEIAKRVEQIFRLETGNFKSTAFRKTGSAGRLWFEKYDKDKPKWCVWIKPKYKDGVFVKNEIVPAGTEGAKKYCYVVYPSVYMAMLGLARHLKKYGIDEGTMRWGHGSDVEQGKKYLAQVKSITPKYV